ncbi:hypothetical protein GIB67_024102 [Kingdonia uniflora]|uniref:Uncharacterized protein n=1 Tax=Kingdonia uniflora TaxID=39325 RepID=A0A7J7MMY1_9MAGN|nr:hypothetical protein GIB67_024102 [Kingdonia uniflora]
MISHMAPLLDLLLSVKSFPYVWLVIGDSNSNIRVGEKTCKGSPNIRSIQDFSFAIDQMGVMESPRDGLRYSWTNGQQGVNRIQGLIDRAFYNQL